MATFGVKYKPDGMIAPKPAAAIASREPAQPSTPGITMVNASPGWYYYIIAVW